MSQDTITRRKSRFQADIIQGRFWLRFMSGGEHELTVDPNLCPKSIHARGHWEPDPDGAEVLNEITGETIVLAQCRCTDADHAEVASSLAAKRRARQEARDTRAELRDVVAAAVKDVAQ